MATTIYTYKVIAYGILVKGGRYALTADGNTDNLPVVPEDYQSAVSEYLVK